MTKQDTITILLTKIFLIAGSLGATSVQLIKDLDLIGGVVLKYISILSFMIVIVINLPKFFKTLKIYVKKVF